MCINLNYGAASSCVVRIKAENGSKVRREKTPIDLFIFKSQNI